MNQKIRENPPNPSHPRSIPVYIVAELFAVAAPGLAPYTAQELHALGLLPAPDTGIEPGGVTFTGANAAIYRANLHLRTANRVLVRLGGFRAVGFDELRKFAGRLAWERFLRPGQPVALRVTCHKSRLYHSDAVAQRVAAAIGDRLGVPPSVQKFDEDSDEDHAAPPPQLILVRLLHDQATVSIDSSGALLHRRGYRLATAKAPLRETLAAGLLLASGWADRPDAPLLDPFCGAGTISVEAALLALGIAPGRQRSFAFMQWPDFDAALWARLLAEADAHQEQQRARWAGRLQILASDRDAGAIALAQENAARAGVADAIQFSCRAVSAIDPPSGPGWLVTNPPYGVRVGAGADLRNLYAQLGKVLRSRCPGWQVALLGNDRRLLGQLGLTLDTSLGLVNGGIKVMVARGTVGARE
jgi:putative N6-adenine-specific DNA methylase